MRGREVKESLGSVKGFNYYQFFWKIYSKIVSYRLGDELHHHKKLTLFQTSFTEGR
jgi:hypothetical protein